MEISSPSDIFNYFKDCYKLDNKEFTVRNVLSKKYKFKWFTKEDEELINEKTPILYYDNPNGKKLEKELQLYKLEKALYYGSFFVLGKQSPVGFSTDTQVCSPLVLYPCELIDMDGDSFIRINTTDFLLNHSLINLIAKDEKSKTALNQKLLSIFSHGIEDAFGIKRALDAYADLHTEELTLFPKNWSIQQLRNRIKEFSIDDRMEIVPASGTIFIEKSMNPIKVISDLESIAEQNEFSMPLQELFNPKGVTYPVHESYLDNKLNADQIKALENGQQYANSVIVGPPGTGKSYTISAMAVDAILHNRSVLIVSKTKQAIEVVRDNLIQNYKLKDVLVDTVGYRFKISLEAKVRKRLAGFTGRLKHKNSEIESLLNDIRRKTIAFESLVEKELKLAELTHKEKLSISEYVDKFFAQLFASNNSHFIEHIEALNQNIIAYNNKLKQYIPQVALRKSLEAASLYRRELNDYYNALLADSFSSSQHIMDAIDFDKIVKIYPIWLAHLPELNTVLPQTKELFDLVIIDEATQCDIATALPAIYRAKKVVVCGDPNQLRHYSFVASNQQKALEEKYGLPNDPILDYRNKSILDVYLDKMPHQEQITFLREHYRSTPSLVAFNNSEFYNNQLEIIKSTTEYTAQNQIEIHYVHGERNSKGVNEIEAHHIIAKIKAIVKENEENKSKPSIGIITPFADQAKYINNLLRDTFDIKVIKAFDMLCGTPYHFQGSEREIILISFCVCNNTHHSAYRHLNQMEVLNVGTTRAKSLQYIYTSVDKSKLDSNSLFAKYLNFVEDYTYQKADAHIEKDAFQKEITTFLESAEIQEIHTAYPFAGYVLDVFFVHKNRSYVIDLIGYPGTFMPALSLERYKTLARVGITTIPLHYRFWRNENDKAKIKIVQQIIDSDSK